jgi:hypothetical protein
MRPGCGIGHRWALLAYAGLQSIPRPYYQAAKSMSWPLESVRFIELPKIMGDEESRSCCGLWTSAPDALLDRWRLTLDDVLVD